MLRLLKFIWKTLVNISLHDPIYMLFDRANKVKPVVIALLVGLFHLGMWVIVDAIILRRYPGENHVHISDPDEFAFGFFLWGIFIPLIWWFYLSFPRFCKNTITFLSEAGLVKDTIRKITPQGPFTLLSLFLALLAGWIYSSRLIQGEIDLGRISFWFVTPWSKFLIVLMVTLNAYVFIAFILNTLFFSYRISRFFSQHGVIDIQLFHVDGCGGFGVVGSLAMRLSSLAVLAGLWAAWYTLIPIFRGGAEPNFDIGVVLVYVVYIILVPMLLLSLTWALHKAMLAYKQAYTSQIGGKLERVFNAIARSPYDQVENNPATDASLKRYQYLLQLYEKADSMAVWPISVINLKKFTVFASLPGVVGFTSFLADLFQIFAGFKY